MLLKWNLKHSNGKRQSAFAFHIGYWRIVFEKSGQTPRKKSRYSDLKILQWKMLIKSIYSKDYGQNTQHMDTKLAAFYDPLLSIMIQLPNISGELNY